MTPAPVRISSTSLRTFLDCPRKWRLDQDEGRSEAGAAAAAGTVFHAIMEARLAGEPDPSDAELCAAPAAYESIQSIVDRLGPCILDEGRTLAELVPDPWAYVWPEARGDEAVCLVEFDLEHECPRVVRQAGQEFVLAGFLDLVILDETARTAYILDWKTKGKSTFKKPLDLSEDTQLQYYASRLAYEHSWIDTVKVRHVTVPRGFVAEPRVDDAEFSSRDLLEWDRAVLRPALTRMADFLRKDVKEVDTNRAACFLYGRCPHMGACKRAN
jgi:hypothetical protein